MDTENSKDFIDSGIIILLGPSACGKGEIAKALCEFWGMKTDRCLSMGSMLRNICHRSKHDNAYATHLERDFGLSSKTPLLKSADCNTVSVKMQMNAEASGLTKLLSSRRAEPSPDWRTATHIEWIEYCTRNGLLIPDEWTKKIISASIQGLDRSEKKPVLLDGYPRTVGAAEHLLEALHNNDLPVVKVLHMVLTKEEMIRRGLQRGRADDTLASLGKRFDFYMQHVVPAIHYLTVRLGEERIGCVDADQPHYDIADGITNFNLSQSIRNVFNSTLCCLRLGETNKNCTRPNNILPCSMKRINSDPK